ncbi:copper chaperone PCu(A)C [Nonomuraea recticatena]|uniref:Copper chaperone PCu(A)C n=1 Tax=Nonomuraea recticatena TaxID=46178 RepID=A0ABP6FXG1_9ACTN
MIRKLATGLLATVLFATACAPEPEMTPTEFYNPNFGVANGIKNGLLLRNAFIVGGRAGAPLQPDAHAPLYVTMINQRAETDTLVSVSATQLFTQARVHGGMVDIRPNDPAGGGPKPQAILAGLTRQLRSGSFVDIDFTFQRAGQLRLQVPVLPPTQWRTQPPVRPFPSS